MKVAASVAAAAALLAGSAAEAQRRARPTQAELFCHDLKRVVEQARFETKFEHLMLSRAAPPWLGFRPGACKAYKATATLPPAWWCMQNLAPDHLTHDKLAAMTAACLPAAKKVKSTGWRESVFETSLVRILISENGLTEGKVGRIVGYRVEAVAAK